MFSWLRNKQERFPTPVAVEPVRWFPLPPRSQLPPLPEGFVEWNCKGDLPADWDGKYVFCEDGTYGLVGASSVQWGEFFPNMGRRVIGYKPRDPNYVAPTVFRMVGVIIPLNGR
jgi:hypothetical protein